MADALAASHATDAAMFLLRRRVKRDCDRIGTVARTGNPNGAGLPAWPEFAEGKPTVMQLGTDAGPIVLPNRARLAALDGYFAWRRGGGR